MTHLTLLSRASDLALLQARQVARALQLHHPGLEVAVSGRSTTGDRDRRIPLSEASDKGLFTADLSEALGGGDGQLVVHSWKDLPIEARSDTVIAGTLERADARDVLLVPKSLVDGHPARLRVLTSSPRRAWQLEQSLPSLLPWAVTAIETVAVRGNIPTRLRKLVEGHGDALVVAKAALDRLLGDDAPDAVRQEMRRLIDRCMWMVLPLREFPTAPAQGALAIEVARARPDIVALVSALNHRPTADAVREEREILSRYGGGCHAAIGVTVLPREYGRVRSLRGRSSDGTALAEWTLVRPIDTIGSATAASIWPRPEERHAVTRRTLDVGALPDADGLWVTRAEALPARVQPPDSQIVWAAGLTTWRKLARRGVWVHGSAEGLGDGEAPAVDRLADRRIEWLRLAHAETDAPGSLATYTAEMAFPDDLASRTHFYWTSGVAFRQAIERYPALRGAEHASGPGRTAAAIRETLGSDGRVSIWLDYEEWRHTILR